MYVVRCVLLFVVLVGVGCWRCVLFVVGGWCQCVLPFVDRGYCRVLLFSVIVVG